MLGVRISAQHRPRANRASVTPSLSPGGIIAAALAAQSQGEAPASTAMDDLARLRSAWRLADQLAPLFSVTSGDVFDALCTIPDNMLSLLETPEGWTALSGYLAADF